MTGEPTEPVVPGQPLVKAVVVAAGTGSRLPGPRPKQFLPLGGEPMLLHSLAAASRAECVSSIILVLPRDVVPGALARLSGPFPKLADVVPGGDRRQDSVRSGAEAAGECDVVVVHDAARPFAAPELFDAVAGAAARWGAAIAAVPVTDTVKRIDASGGISGTVDRSRLVLSQTPQAFRRELLMEALDSARSGGIVATDEAALVERLGRTVRTVEGSPLNIKVTREEDLLIARALAGGAGGAERRVGVGEDRHPLVEGRRLFLGGVEIPFPRGLEGHSDGDAAIHAIIDALCGAASLPSIGELFPDTDPTWRGAASTELLAGVAGRLREGGWELSNLDCVVLCDAPRLASHVPEMRRRIAGALKAPEERIGIKGTSAEGLGPEGEGRAISARAVALLHRRPGAGRKP